MVKARPAPGHQPFRPSATAPVNTVIENSTSEEVLQCLTMVMTECWSEREHVRPSFDICVDLIYRLTGDKYVTYNVASVFLSCSWPFCL